MMKKQKIVLGSIAILFCSFLMISGCMQQNTPSPETLQQILEKAQTIESVYYEISTSMTTNNTLIQNSTIKIWQKTPYLKEEVSYINNNISQTISYIKRPEGLYRYDTTQQKYILVPLLALPEPSTQEVSNDLLNNQTLTTLGNETIDEKETIVIQYTSNQTGNYSMKMWIWKEKGIPVKALKTMTKKEGTTTIIEYRYKNHSFLDIPASTFEVS